MNPEQTRGKDGSGGMQMQSFVCAQLILLRVYYKRDNIESYLVGLASNFVRLIQEFKIISSS